MPVEKSNGVDEVALSEEHRKVLDRCKAELVEIGVVLRGSVTRHYVRCGKKGCRCQATPPRLHGPYYDWTRKVRGKTKTIRLTKALAETYLRWIENGRRLNRIVADWERVGLEAAEIIREISRR